MDIISEFVREQKRYSKSDLKRIYHLSPLEIDGFIRNLKAIGVLKAVKNNLEQRELSDLIDKDIEVADVENEEDHYLYVFTYVGVITIGSRIIKCYPKYLLSNNSPVEEMKQVLKVVGRYGSKEQIINMYNGDAEYSRFNILAVILFLLNDYHEYGVYNNSEDIIEVNGEGEILWDKTINESFLLISNNRPYYMELSTKKTVDNEFDFFKRLHECVLTECSMKLENANLLDLFELVPINLSEEVLNEIGDVEFILYQLQSELNIQFNTRKQILLKTLYAYIAHISTLEDSYGISMYGTNGFNLVWEDVCSQIFNNKLHMPLEKLGLPVPLHNAYQPSEKLIDIIDKPVWSGRKSDGAVFEKVAKESLIPDIITLWQHGDTYRFVILDAKYYNIQLEEGRQLRGQPGVSDVTKQYLYQLAYQNFINDHHIKEVRNYFLLPSESNLIINKGTVKMEILSSMGLQDIQVVQLPARQMFRYYLSNRTMDVTVLD